MVLVKDPWANIINEDSVYAQYERRRSPDMQ